MTQLDEKYNGWTNWETWNCNLWLTSDEATYFRIVRTLIKMKKDDCTHREKIEYLQEEICNNLELLRDGVRPNKVNFEEILDSFEE